MSFKEQLRDEILPKTVEYYNGGLDINSAIVKAASDFRLNVDQADRLVETMNTARVIAHYEKNAQDRTSNCDIADKGAVRRMLFEEKTEKKASAGAVAFHDYSAYESPETNYRAAKPMVKAAEAAARPKATDGFSRRQVVDRVVKYASQLETMRKFAEERRGMAEASLSVRLTKLAESLSKGYEPEVRYALFKTACSAKFPKAVKAVEGTVSSSIVKAAAPHLRKLRRANVFDPSGVSSEISAAGSIESDLAKMAEFDGIIDRLGKKEAGVKRLVSEYHGTEKRAQMPFGGGGGNGGGGGGGGGGGHGGGGSGGGHGGGGGGGGGGGRRIPWTARVKNVHDRLMPVIPGEQAMYDFVTSSILSPERIEEAISPSVKPSTGLRDFIDNVRRSAIISELVADDEILSEADPNAVTAAYQMLVQTSPETSLNKEVVRSILRQSVNSVAVSPFDAKQWADFDKSTIDNQLNMRKRDNA